MSDIPLPNARDQIIADLNQKMDQFFASGKTAEQISSVVSGEKQGLGAPSYSKQLRRARDKDAVRLEELVEAGMTLLEAAKEMGMEAKWAHLIAKESIIRFAEPS
ncbi:hypothetical protein ACIQVE_22385 [Pseudomonas sp. NPDC098747]|uniref:hypothetical protein n=1 Tax=Pseudomonas sp. NPDC098747 TaxID=3364487 RepID=UPI00383BEBDB